MILMVPVPFNFVHAVITAPTNEELGEAVTFDRRFAVAGGRRMLCTGLAGDFGSNDGLFG